MSYPSINQTSTSENSSQNLGQAERVISAALGSWLVLSSFGRSSFISRSSKFSLGGYLLYRGITGNCAVYDALGITGENSQTVELRSTLTVNKPRSEVYKFWRKLENLPKFMEHLNSVKEIDNKRSHWVAKIPGNIGSIEWDAEITEEKKGELIAWQSVENATIYNSGNISFKDAIDGIGTEVTAKIIYQPPAGKAGAVAAKILNPVFQKIVKADIRRFKEVMENGEVAGI
jgi:uncharacterized membrane protein